MRGENWKCPRNLMKQKWTERETDKVITDTDIAADFFTKIKPKILQ